jgi:hypothetical protein
MSLVDVKTYFRSRSTTLGFAEWSDPINPDNIPESIVDRAYFMRFGTITARKQNMSDLELSAPINYRVYFKAFNDELNKYDEATTLANACLLEILKQQNKNCLTPSIKDVKLVDLSIDPISADNDNTWIINFNFEVFLIINPNN